MKNTDRQPRIVPCAQAEQEPLESAQESALRDAVPPPPNNGLTPAAELADDAGPSLAPSGDPEAALAAEARAEGTASAFGHPANSALPLPPVPAARRGSLASFNAHAATPAPLGIPASQAALSPLEERLRRLEDALAQAADPRQIETRIVERVAERLSQQRPIPVAQLATALPANVPEPGVTRPGGMIVTVGKHLLNTTPGLAKTGGGATAAEPQETALMSGIRRTYLFFDLLTEARAIWCMYTDPRYRMSWGGRLVPLALALFILTSAFLTPGAQLFGVGTLIDKFADLIPAFILFKLLTYEARRYRETAPDLPADLRL